jgi:hypothetical protein
MGSFGRFWFSGNSFRGIRQNGFVWPFLVFAIFSPPQSEGFRSGKAVYFTDIVKPFGGKAACLAQTGNYSHTLCLSSYRHHSNQIAHSNFSDYTG